MQFAVVTYDSMLLLVGLDNGLEPSEKNPSIEDVSGEQFDFEEVLKLFHGKIYNLSYRLLGNPDEAADLTQETFVKAYRAYSSFHGDFRAVYAWLCRIAINSCRSRFRHTQRRPKVEVISIDETVVTFGDSLAPNVEVADKSTEPATILERREFEAKVQEAIEALPPDFRLVVVLRDIHGLSYREIAEVTGLTLDSVKIRLFRGRSALRKRLAPYINL